MYGKVTIGNEDVEMVANAASPYFYRKIFQKDFLQECQDKTPDPALFERMGFVMAMQGKHPDNIGELMKLKEEDFVGWLMNFDPMDVLLATREISTLYYSQDTMTSIAKKKHDLQTGSTQQHST